MTAEVDRYRCALVEDTARLQRMLKRGSKYLWVRPAPGLLGRLGAVDLVESPTIPEGANHEAVIHLKQLLLQSGNGFGKGVVGVA